MQIEELNGKRVQVSARTITVKDENNKTQGMVRNVTNFMDLQANKQIDYWKIIKQLPQDISRTKILVDDGKLYYLCDMYSLNVGFDEEKERKKADVEKMKDLGINVIECQRVFWSERRR